MKARDWERIYQQRGDLNLRILPKVKRAAKTFKEKKYQKILDLGCGTGKHSIFLAAEGFQVYATDISETGLKITREKAESLGLNNISIKRHDMKEIPFDDSFFDAVICTWTIYHGTLAEITATFGEIYRVLRQNGTFITDFLSPDDYSYGLGKEIERNTFLGSKKNEEDVPHHYFQKKELTYLLSDYKQLDIKAASYSFLDEKGERFFRKYYDVEAVK